MSKFLIWLRGALAVLGITLPNIDQFLSWLRSTMASLGVVLIQHGWTNNESWVAITGIVLFVAPFIWGLFVHTMSAKIAAVEAIPGVEKIIVDPAATGPLAEIVDDQLRPKVVAADPTSKSPEPFSYRR